MKMCVKWLCLNGMKEYVFKIVNDEMYPDEVFVILDIKSK